MNEAFKTWIGHRQTRQDRMDPERAAALAAALASYSREVGGAPFAAEAVPPLRHWLYF